MQINVGFEIELILDDLGRPEFHLDEIGEEMDIATDEYCQAIAEILTEGTGKKWSAQKEDRDRDGYYVVPEYDLDPLDFIEGQIGGVELITPPLPLEQADQLREQIIATIEPYAEGMLSYPDHFSGSGWHINVDIDGKMPDPVRWLVMVDEYEIMSGSGREGQPGSGSTVRPVLLAAIDAALAGGTLPITEEYLTMVVRDRSDQGKRHATNFSRGTYVELRHLGAEAFLSEVPLRDYLAPLLNVDLSSDEEYRTAFAAMQKRLEVLGDFARRNADRIVILDDCSRKNYCDTARDVLVDGELSAITRKELLSIRSFDGSAPSTYGDKNITVVPSTENFEAYSISERETGSVEAQVITLAYEALVLGCYGGDLSPEPKSGAFQAFGEEIGQALWEAGVSMAPSAFLSDEAPQLYL
jgi:hypothetical protein